MPEIIDRRISFNAGELSPWLDPRVDLDKYRMGCRTLQNMTPNIYGGAFRRPGTQYLGAAAASDSAVRLVAFTVDSDTHYLLEFSHLLMRVWNAEDAALVCVTDVPVEMVTPYTTAQLGQLQFVQQNDLCYIAHPDHFPRVISRYAETDWRIDRVADAWPATVGPNITTATITPLVAYYNLFGPATYGGGTYALGAYVTDAGIHYVSLAGSNTGHTPATNPTWWRRVLWIADDNIYQAGEPADWTSASVGQGVTRKSGGLYYTSLQAANANHTPASSPTWWRVGAWIPTSLYGEPAAYSAAVDYTTGQKVKYNSKYYVRTSWQSGLQDGVAPGSQPYGDAFWKQTTYDVAAGDYEKLAVGQTVGLLCSSALFTAGHVGSKWVVSHKRDDLTREIKLNNVTAGTAGAITAPLYVLGEWSAQTNATGNGSGAWKTTVLVERSDDQVNWETHNLVVSSESEVNQLLTGNEDVPVFLRLNYALCEGASNVAPGIRAELQAGAPDHAGIVEITEYVSTTLLKGVVKSQLLESSATRHWEEPAWCGGNGYPRAVTLHQARLFFGGTTAKPTTLWGSAVDSYEDFRVAAAADRAVMYTLQADEAATIEWCVSQDFLIIGTSAGEWVLGERPGEDIPKLRRNTLFGTAPIQARAVNDSIVFISHSQRKLREYSWSLERDGYAANDLTMLAEHLGDARMTQIAISRNPEARVWCVTERGDLLSLTYERGQNVAGWCRHVTDGAFESLAVVAGSGEDDHVWVSTVRTVNNATVRYIERFVPDQVYAMKGGEEKELVFADCALVLTGQASEVITGLDHLEGCGVSVLADGAVHPNLGVVSGQITLDAVAETVVVGLEYIALLEPTYLETGDPQTLSKAAKKRMHRAMFQFWKTGGVQVSVDGGATYSDLVFSTTEDLMDAPAALHTGLHEEWLKGGTEREVTCILRMRKPLPAAVQAMVLRYSLEMT